ncbi:hypothetical protein [Polynucleobacter sp. Fuers-14]|uniref:hypothetical protein n=1 Tax=Polynucleobacter sp. Fuers-14 TaxID=1758364 RepID=UPI001C0B588F|nr:hypothetical protein [Polynucleobacter sp. Fuers-14]MBU3640545.1 hypothetical protein [Polynucleobacter sp. Fuers-14]
MSYKNLKFEEPIKYPSTFTRKGPGRRHKAKADKKRVTKISFASAITEWITQQNLKQMAIRLSKKQAA